MRKLMALCVALALTGFCMAQNVGIGTSTPDASAQLDVTSTNSGFLAPRMTLAQRHTITSPATGLLIYQTDNTPGFYYYDGSTWKLITAGGKAWFLKGNTGTDPANNFMGTKDDQPLNFRVNNTRAGYLSSNGNVFWGIGSGYSNTTGYSNVAIGNNALYMNSDGLNLVAIGDSALYKNLGTTYNTAIGYKALTNNITGGANTAIGAFALMSNTEGNTNTANGKYALTNNTTGSSNTAEGTSALASNTIGNNNTANGSASLVNNISGYANTASGENSLFANTSGHENTATGRAALYYNTIANDNSAHGYDALFFNTTGNGNTANGALALSNNTTGSYNTALGYQANVSTGNLTNATAIGYFATVNASNKIRLGNSSVTVIEGQVAYSFPSDARFKYNIKENVPGLDFITKLKPVTYYFDTQKLDTYTKTGVIDNSIIHPVNYSGAEELHTGFLAQDVEKIAEELGYQFDGIHKPANDRDHYSLAYSQFIMPLVKAVQEQQEMIKTQQKMNEDLRAQIKENKIEQQKLIEDLQAQIKELKTKLK